MWKVAAGFTLLIAAGGAYETWAIAVRPKWAITELVKRYTHLALILSVAISMLLGYALGVGGR